MYLDSMPTFFFFGKDLQMEGNYLERLIFLIGPLVEPHEFVNFGLKMSGHIKLNLEREGERERERVSPLSNLERSFISLQSVHLFVIRPSYRIQRRRREDLNKKKERWR